MWFVRAFFAIVVLAGLLYIALINSGQQVNIFLTNPNIPDFPNVELPVALLSSFVAGVMVWFFVSVFQVLGVKSSVARLKRRNRELTRELTDLRNMTVKDLDPDALATPVESEGVRGE